PGVCENVSQMETPRPSSFTAPSTWYDAVADPQRKPFGNACAAATASCSSVFDGPTRAAEAIAGCIVAIPANFVNPRRVMSLKVMPPQKLVLFAPCYTEGGTAWQGGFHCPG